MVDALQKAYVNSLKRFAARPFVFESPDAELCFLTSELGIPRLTLDPLFRRFMSHWNDGPTLDAAYFALEALLIADPTFILPERFVNVLQRSLRACYLPSEGGFWPSPFGSTASLYGTICAIGVMKSLGHYGCKERPGNSVAECNAYYSKFTGGDFVRGLEGLLQARVVESVGAFYDSSEWRIPCVISTSVASSILWNIGHNPNKILDWVDKEKLQTFLSECIHKHEDFPIRWGAFKPHPKHTRPGLSITYHALKLINRLELHVPLQRSEIRDFVHLCWTGKGFGGTVGDSPSLISTYYALAILQDEELCGRDDEFLHQITSRLEEFVVSCCRRHVYSITPGMFPTITATRYAFQICVQQLNNSNLVDTTLATHSIPQEFWKEGEGFMAYPVQLVQKTSLAYSGYSLLQALTSGFALALSPLWLLRSILRTAWVHRKT